MESSNEERREVAARLRGLDSEITSRDTLERAADKFCPVCGVRLRLIRGVNNMVLGAEVVSND